MDIQQMLRDSSSPSPDIEYYILYGLPAKANAWASKEKLEAAGIFVNEFDRPELPISWAPPFTRYEAPRYIDIWAWLKDGFAAEELPEGYMLVSVPRITSPREDVYAIDTDGNILRSRNRLRQHVGSM